MNPEQRNLSELMDDREKPEFKAALADVIADSIDPDQSILSGDERDTLTKQLRSGNSTEALKYAEERGFLPEMMLAEANRRYKKRDEANDK